MMCYVTASYYHGYAYVLGRSDQEVAGLALWLPPGTDLTLMKMIKFGFGKVPLDCGVEASMRWQKLYSAWSATATAAACPHLHPRLHRLAR